MKTEIKDNANKVTITLDGDTGDITVGGNAQDGDLIVTNTTGTERVRLDGQTGSITARSAAMVEVFGVNGDTGDLVLRGVNPPGQGSARIVLNPSNANISAGGNGQGGDLILSDSDGFFRFGLNANSGNLYIRDRPEAGAPLPLGQIRIELSGASGSIKLKDSTGKDRIRLDGANANAWLGGNGANGDVVLFASGGDNSTPAKATVYLDGANGNIRVGGPGVHGNLALFRADVTEADSGNFDKATIHLNASTGDIILANADCAEDFDIAETEGVVPGTVMVLDEEGKLQRSREAYDKKVAGVISGAGGFKPGIVLDKKQSPANRMPVALVGKVYCKVDARYLPVEVGDLLTTSHTPGHAMKADDPLKAFGAVIGKALRPLQAGQTLIPILIALQ